MRGVLRGVAIEVEVGAEINPIGIKGPSTPEKGSTQIPVIAGIITEAATQEASCSVELAMQLNSVMLLLLLYVKSLSLNSLDP